MTDLKWCLSLLSWILTIGTAGGLVDLTIDMSRNAWRANHVGLVALTSLTRQLMSPDRTVVELNGVRHPKQN